MDGFFQGKNFCSHLKDALFDVREDNLDLCIGVKKARLTFVSLRKLEQWRGEAEGTVWQEVVDTTQAQFQEKHTGI